MLLLLFYLFCLSSSIIYLSPGLPEEALLVYTSFKILFSKSRGFFILHAVKKVSAFVHPKEHMNSFTHVPPGFRFHPTDEELVDYYLRKKVASKRIDLDVIREVDLYKIEPWDLQELCKIGSDQEVDEWYFFSHKDKKYPTGTRTNRATKAGFWKATGRDKAIYAKHSLIGMRKTLVFYKGRAPNGMKSDWIMHEYRLETNENAITTQEEGWVVCRVFKKRMPVMQRASNYESPCYFDNQVSFMPELDSPKQIISQTNLLPNYRHHQYSCKQEVELQYNNMPHHEDNFLQLPQLESPNGIAPYLYGTSSDHGSSFPSFSTLTQVEQKMQETHQQGLNEQAIMDQVTDWRVLDKFVASQLSHDNAVLKNNNYSSNSEGRSSSDSKKPEVASQEFPLISSSSCPIELWK